MSFAARVSNTIKRSRPPVPVLAQSIEQTSV
jgi:hypothetical protein